jgi:ribosomal protein S17
MNSRKSFIGVVKSVSDASTFVVEVVRLQIHPKYQKQYTVTKSYTVHNADKVAVTVGQKVEFAVCRPISKMKSHILVTR